MGPGKGKKKKATSGGVSLEHPVSKPTYKNVASLAHPGQTGKPLRHPGQAKAQPLRHPGQAKAQPLRHPGQATKSLPHPGQTFNGAKTRSDATPLPRTKAFYPVKHVGPLNTAIKSGREMPPKARPQKAVGLGSRIAKAFAANKGNNQALAKRRMLAASRSG